MQKNDNEYLSDQQLKDTILKYLENDRYRLTKHADQELKKDDLDVTDVLYILKTGRHNYTKTGLDTKTQTWKYAIEGKTKESREDRKSVV